MSGTSHVFLLCSAEITYKPVWTGGCVGDGGKEQGQRAGWWRIIHQVDKLWSLAGRGWWKEKQFLSELHTLSLPRKWPWDGSFHTNKFPNCNDNYTLWPLPLFPSLHSPGQPYGQHSSSYPNSLTFTSTIYSHLQLLLIPCAVKSIKLSIFKCSPFIFII